MKNYDKSKISRLQWPPSSQSSHLPVISHSLECPVLLQDPGYLHRPSPPRYNSESWSFLGPEEDLLLSNYINTGRKTD